MRARWALLGILVVMGAAVAFLLIRDGGTGLYPDLRQRSTQEIPGTLGMSLAPPSDAGDLISPTQARAAMEPVPEDTRLVLAGVRDPLEGLAADPVWVGVARGLCLRDSKGELVSDARGNDPNDLECTDATFQVIAVDAQNARVVLNTTGYDETLAWAPDIAGPT